MAEIAAGGWPGLASTRQLLYSVAVFGLSGGEFFIVAFVTAAVISARYWPALGERIAVRLNGGAPDPGSGSIRPSRGPDEPEPPRQ